MSHETTGMQGPVLTYVLITPARNEEEYIEYTLRSMVAQTRPPRKWIIVSDGSTDRTEAIVSRYLSRHPWMELLRRPERAERHFAAKVAAFNAGYERIRELDYDVIGNLDADVSFDPNYLEYLLEKMEKNPRLGVVGTNREEGALVYDYRFTSIEDVSGACQLFRRACFEAIGGYQPIKGGGIDSLAVLTARFLGWQTRTHTDMVLTHHRPAGTATGALWRTHFKDGRRDYMLGGHPLWEVFRAIYRARRRPFLLSSCLLLLGYFWPAATRVPRAASHDLVRFRQREQLGRLRKACWDLVAHFGSSLRGGPAPLDEGSVDR